MIISGKAENVGTSQNVIPSEAVPPHVVESQGLPRRNASQQRRLIRRKVFSSPEPGHNQRVVLQPSAGD
jgi:hypothetical protein